MDVGASVAKSPAAAVTGADSIIAIVGDDHSAQEIWLGQNGVVAGTPKPNAIAIESTTLSLEWVLELRQTLVSHHLRFIDSPVTGGRTGAETGTLTLLVGAEEETLAAARPVMET